MSKKINEDLNNHKVGSHGGTKPSDINNKNSNRMDATYDEDRDGKSDYGVSRELSEDVNAKEE